MTNADERATPPAKLSRPDELFPFRVWACSPSYAEDAKPWKCVAMFRFLPECLDYIGYCHSRECDVVFQSPAHTTLRPAPAREELIPAACPF